MVKPTQIIGQGELTDVLEHQPKADLIPPVVPSDFELRGKRITASRLIHVIGDAAGIDESYTTVEDLARVRPALIDANLYIDWKDPRHESAKDRYQDVVFPSGQWLRLARSPNDLAKHTYSRTELADTKKPEAERAPDREALRARASRAAGHVVVNKLVDLERLHVELSDQHQALGTFLGEIKSGGFAHYPGDQLDGLRKVAHHSIHQAVESAYVNASWDDTTVDGLHRAITYKLYGLQGHSNQRLINWKNYVTMVHNYAARRIDAVVTSMHASQAVLEQYIDFLPDVSQPEYD